MHLNKTILTISLLSVFLISCSSKKTCSNDDTPEVIPELTLDERLHNAYLDSIEAKQENIRPLVNLTQDDENIIWNEDKTKVLLFTLHRFPSSYPEGETKTITWSESWLCSLKEYKDWYLTNKNNINDSLLRTKQVLGMSHESQNTYISSLWMDPSEIKRPAYITDPTKPMALQFDENESEEYKTWFKNQYYYSYDVNKLPWTRLGYTYDWSEEAKDRYGLSEFIAFKGATFTVDRTLTVSEFLKTFE